MMNLFKKDDKGIDGFLPEHLRIGNNIEFVGLEFSNVGTNSKFIFEKEGIFVESIGTANIEGVEFVNLYLGGVEEQEAYLQLCYEDNKIVDSKLFVNYDYIYPQSKEEWLYWLGNDKLEGIIGDDTFIIDESPIEKIGRLLFKIASSFYEGLHNIDDFDFYEEDAYISTNLLEKVCKLSGASYDEVKLHFEAKLEDEEWFLDMQRDGNTTLFYYTFLEEELQTEYYNVYTHRGRAYKYKEKVYRIDRESGKAIKEVREKKGALYSRVIEDEFFEEEYILINYVQEKKGKRIAIDLGIPLHLNNLINTKDV